MRRYKLDLILSITIIIFSLIVILIIPYQVRVPDNLKGTYLSPALFPFGYSVFLLVMGGLLLLSTIITKKLLKEQEEKEDKKDEQNGIVVVDKKSSKENFFMAIKLWIIFIIFMLLMKYVGMLIASIIFMYFTIVYFGNGSSTKRVTILVSVLLPIVVYSFFHFIARVPLPNGFLFDYFF